MFPAPANGSLIVRDGHGVGSELIGQPFSDDPRYFWGRPSATTPTPYNAAASPAPTLGRRTPRWKRQCGQGSPRCKRHIPDQIESVPVDLVTASASGLDPHISPAAAEYQVARVAKARGLTETRVRQLVAACTEGRTLGLLGEPRVNVLK